MDSGYHMILNAADYVFDNENEYNLFSAVFPL